MQADECLMSLIQTFKCTLWRRNVFDDLGIRTF